MPARKSMPAQDHTGESLFGLSTVTQTPPDGAPARHYRNDGKGLSEESGQNYNEARGRVATAHTVGGDAHANRSAKGMPPGAPKSKRTKPID